MTSYPKYKPSGIEWIGDIPEHWQVMPIKRLSQVKRGASPRPIDDPQYFDGNGEYGWVRIADVTASERYLESTLQKLSELGASLSVKRYPNDFFLSIAGSVGKPIITKIKCCIHDGFVYFPSLKLNPEYMYYIFSTGLPYQGLGKLGTQLNLNTDTVGDINIPLPPLSKINSIVNYLDQQTTKIDTAITQKQKLIELLKEEKTAIINEAVTKGINPNVKLKPSGIEWLGDIPEHWEIRKISRSFKTIGSGTTPKAGHDEYYQNGTINWINTGDLNDGFLYKCEKKITTDAFKEYSTLKIYPVDTLLIALYGATIGKVAVTKIEGCSNQACCALAESEYFCIMFVYYWFIANRQNIINLGYGGGQPNISQEIIRFLRLPCPSILEQITITDYLDQQTSQIDHTITRIENEIELMKEYRVALISEVVTGKVKVS